MGLTKLHAQLLGKQLTYKLTYAPEMNSDGLAQPATFNYGNKALKEKDIEINKLIPCHHFNQYSFTLNEPL